MMKKSHHTPTPSLYQSGYTLIQMAIALLIIGIVAAVLLQTYSLYEQNQKMITTRDNIENAVYKIQLYRQGYGHYLCPSSMNADRTDANYGVASDYATYKALAVGTCSNGVCIEQSPRTDISPAPRVRIGAIPFRDLQMAEDETFDGYGSRIWYAVTEDMCDATTFSDTKGGVGIVNERDETQVIPLGSAAFIVVAPGANKVGGYSKTGTLQKGCTGSADIENCRDVAVSPQTNTVAKYLSSFQSDATAATTYDDIVQYFSSEENQLWRRENKASNDIVNIGNENVGIGTNNPTTALSVPQTTVDTSSGGMAITDSVATNAENGALRAEGKILAQKYCDDTTTTNCFQPKDIVGTIAGGGGIECPAGQYPVGIKSDGTNAKFECKDEIGVFCPEGQVLTGFTGTPRRPVCSDIATTTPTTNKDCPAITLTSGKDQDGKTCAANISLPASPDQSGTNQSIQKYYGACVIANYRCVNGTWTVVDGSPWLFCENTARTAVNWSCGEGYSGTQNGTSYACGGREGVPNLWEEQCLPTCIPYDKVQTKNCENGGQIKTTTHMICDSKGYHIPDPNNPTTTTGACTGTCSPIVTTAACPDSSQSGSIKTTTYQKYDANGKCVVDSTKPPLVESTCACDTTPKTNFYSCASAGHPSGYTRKSPPDSKFSNGVSISWPSSTSLGVAKYTTVNNTNNTCVSTVVATTDNCICEGGYVYETKTPTEACKLPKTGTRNVDGTQYDYQYDVWKYAIDSNTCVKNNSSGTLVSPAEFQNAEKPYIWKAQGAKISGGGQSSYPKVGDSCTCSTQANTERACRDATNSNDAVPCKCLPSS